MLQQDTRAPRNRTLSLSESDERAFGERLLRLDRAAAIQEILDRTIHQDLFEILDALPRAFVDLLIVDPPYNLSKRFNELQFGKRTTTEYGEWLESWLPRLLRVLKPTGTVYICGDWRSSAAIHLTAEKYLTVRNRITWEREKGRGAKTNWKNCAEDIWFCTASNTYIFNVDAVKLRRRVVAPYRDPSGQPKDWESSVLGDFRLTHPSNLWSDITVPFWSMPENTSHPTQKPEKLIAKLILASSNTNDVVLDPFLGSGTSSVVAKKLGRRYVGIEIDRDYCLLAEKRLASANRDSPIQGFARGAFWERNSQGKGQGSSSRRDQLLPLSDESVT